jgi:hypothetical protein
VRPVPPLGLLLVLSAGFSQSLPARSDSIVVTGTWGPLNLDEPDRSITVLPLRTDALLRSGMVEGMEVSDQLL